MSEKVNEDPIRLTSLAACAGCAAKLKAETLTEILHPVQEIFRVGLPGFADRVGRSG